MSGRETWGGGMSVTSHEPVYAQFSGPLFLHYSNKPCKGQ